MQTASFHSRRINCNFAIRLEEKEVKRLEIWLKYFAIVISPQFFLIKNYDGTRMHCRRILLELDPAEIVGDASHHPNERASWKHQTIHLSNFHEQSWCRLYVEEAHWCIGHAILKRSKQDALHYVPGNFYLPSDVVRHSKFVLHVSTASSF